MPQIASHKLPQSAVLDYEWQGVATGFGYTPPSMISDDKPDWLVDLESRPTEWLKFFFPDQFDRDFCSFQKDFWEWGKTIQLDEYLEPRVECEPRGVGKSSNLRALVVYCLAMKVRRYVLYVSETHNQAEKHFQVIQQMLGNQLLLKHYPHLAPAVSERKDSIKKWSAKGLITAANQLVEFLSINSNARGFNSAEGNRIDFLALDDIDAKTDSPHVTQKKLDILASDLIPAGNDNTLVCFAQNLIHRNSICVKLQNQTADILSDREFVGPFPMMKSYKAERVKIPGSKTGAMRWAIIDGQPYDPAISVEYCEKLLNKMGKAAFDRECQQKVFEIEADKDFREYDEIYHVITYSEFISSFTRLKTRVLDAHKNLHIPRRWNVGRGLDFGTTPEHPSGIIYAARPDRNTPLNDSHFLFGHICRPLYPAIAGEIPELVSPGRLAKAMNALEFDWQISDSQIKVSLMSHEQSAALNTMLIDLPEKDQQVFNKWQAKKGSGVPQIQNLLEIDYSKKHPFRVYPKGFLDENGVDVGGKPLMGKPRFFIIVPDEQGELFADEAGNLYVRQGYDDAGFARLRDEIPLYSQYNTGKDKIFDDLVDALKGLMNVFGVDADDQTEEEKREEKLPNHLKKDEISQHLGTNKYVDLLSAREVKLNKLKKLDKREGDAAANIAANLTNRVKTNARNDDFDEFEMIDLEDYEGWE